MRSYLSGLIVPLTPSTRPTNVEHLAKKEEHTVWNTTLGCENHQQVEVMVVPVAKRSLRETK
jgi:hypothetical protein